MRCLGTQESFQSAPLVKGGINIRVNPCPSVVLLQEAFYSFKESSLKRGEVEKGGEGRN